MRKVLRSHQSIKTILHELRTNLPQNPTVVVLNFVPIWCLVHNFYAHDHSSTRVTSRATSHTGVPDSPSRLDTECTLPAVSRCMGTILVPPPRSHRLRRGAIDLLAARALLVPMTSDDIPFDISAAVGSLVAQSYKHLPPRHNRIPYYNLGHNAATRACSEHFSDPSDRRTPTDTHANSPIPPSTTSPASAYRPVGFPCRKCYLPFLRLKDGPSVRLCAGCRNTAKAPPTPCTPAGPAGIQQTTTPSSRTRHTARGRHLKAPCSRNRQVNRNRPGSDQASWRKDSPLSAAVLNQFKRVLRSHRGCIIARIHRESPMYVRSTAFRRFPDQNSVRGFQACDGSSFPLRTRSAQGKCSEPIGSRSLFAV